MSSKKKRKTNYVDYADNETILLTDGTEINFIHQQDCCEEVYADLGALRDTGFEEDTSIKRENLKIRLVDGYGLRLNGYGIPCYNSQNGYYNDKIQIYINDKLYKNISCEKLNIGDYF